MTGAGWGVVIGGAVLLLGVIYFAMQSVRVKLAPLGRMLGIQQDVRHNLRLTGQLGYRNVKRRFQTRSWDIYKNTLDFLEPEFFAELNVLFDKIHRLNNAMDEATETRRENILTAVNPESMKAPLAEAEKKLAAWIEENGKNPVYAPSRFPRFLRK